MTVLCEKCQALCNAADPESDVDFTHHDIVEFRRSALAGCRLCGIVYADLDKRADQSLDPSSSVSIKIRRDKGLEVSFDDPSMTSTAGGTRKPPRVYVLFQALELPPRLQTTLRLVETLRDTNTGSDASFMLAQTWLDECRQNHPSCMRTVLSADDQSLPNRVIDVGPSDGSQEPSLLQTHGRKGRYLALSHCWGQLQPLRTIKSNQEEHRSRIKLEHLPRTFREAVCVTRKLDVRYLWIDSLCIVQDDEEDWRIESALMDQYYTKSLLTIAAADARGSDEGLFRDRDRLRYQACELHISVAGGTVRRVYASTNSMSFEMQRSSLSPSFRPSPLYSRAWVLQEQLLSPRTLSFFRDRMAWRCQQVYFDERVPFVQEVEDPTEGRGSTVTMGRDPRSSDQTFSRFQKKWVFVSQRDPLRASQAMISGHHKHDCYPTEARFYLDWADVVREYTERSMTYHKDKLIALKGIADAVSAVSGRRYHAGVWIDSPLSTLLGLLWTSTRRRPDSQRLDLAPSWSWASTTSQIMWLGHLLCQPEPRMQFLSLGGWKTATDGKSPLIIETSVRPGRKDGDNFVFLTWTYPQTSEDAISDIVGASCGVPVALDEALADGTVVLFAEVAAGVNHARRGLRELHCLVLVSGQESLYRRVGYAVWLESDWVGVEVSSKKTRLTIA